MTMYHICSGCENVCDISSQYCDECLYQIAQDDAIDNFEESGTDCYSCAVPWCKNLVRYTGGMCGECISDLDESFMF